MSKTVKMGYKRGYKTKVGDKSREVLENIDENNPVIQMFRSFAVSLDDKHDRYERIIKLSRDITIESKRIIFLLHNRETDIETKRDKLFDDAKLRLNQLVEKQFRSIALELEGFDAHQYLRAYTAGLQEFIEALVFYQYLRNETIDEWGVINDSFVYVIKEEDNPERSVKLLFPQVEFILGMADFTGELMRKCINNLGAGKVEESFKICQFVKYIHTGFLGINTTGYKEIGRKLYVLKQSLAKMELVCYNIKVRGSEVPKHMLGMMVSSGADDVAVDDDEGYY